MFRQKWTNTKVARRQADIYERLWRNFTRFPTAEDGRHDDSTWNESSGDFCACVIRIPIDSLQPAIVPLRDSLATTEGVRAHPDAFLHLMLQELGQIVDGSESRYEVTPERLEEFISAAETELAGAPAFWLHLGGANAFRDSVFLEAKDEGQTERIHRRLNELAALPARASYAYLPHVTVAHLTPDASIRDLTRLLEPHRNTNFGAVYVDHVELIMIDVQQEYPELEIKSRFQLSG